MKFLRSFLAAIVTFTRIPVGWNIDARDFERASLQLPFLGFILGGLQVGLLVCLPKYIAMDLALFLTLMLPILLSGGMHEDGLADFADGMLGGHSIERRLEIMKDPRVGSYGVLALLIILPGSFLALRGIQQEFQTQALLAAMVFSRSLSILLMSTLPYKSQAGSRSRAYLPEHIQGFAKILPHWPLLVLLGFLKDPGTILSYAVLLVLLLVFLRSYLQKKLEGITGDCLGAAIKIAEFAFLLLGSVLWA